MPTLPSQNSSSGQVQAPILKKRFQIAYPEQAQIQKRQGQAVAILTIDEKGQVVAVGLESATDPEFAQSAIEALWKYQFSPATHLQQPVLSKIRFVVRFQY